MKKLLALLPLLYAAHAGATVISIDLDDIGTFAGQRNTNLASTYAGTGYLGMYTTAWGHVLGVESANFSRTIMQVDIAAFAGMVITDAVLSFDLKDGATGVQNGTVTGFDGGSGRLAYRWNAPAVNYGSVKAPLKGRATNNFDVTALLAASVANGDDWFGMLLRGSTLSQWTSANYSTYANGRANMHLDVSYEKPVVVSAPATPMLFGAGLLVLALRRRKQ